MKEEKKSCVIFFFGHDIMFEPKRFTIRGKLYFLVQDKAQIGSFDNLMYFVPDEVTALFSGLHFLFRKVLY